MTEREKMLAGELYDCGDSELLNQWHKAKNLMRDYNLTDTRNAEERIGFYRNCLAAAEKTCGLPLLFMWITETTFILETTAR